MKRNLLLVGLGCSLIALFSSPVHPFQEGSGIGSQPFIPRQESQHRMSLDEAVRRVQRQTGGRILSAESLPGAGGISYRIKVLLPSGRVRVILVDSQP